MTTQNSRLGAARPLAWFSCRFSLLVGALVLLSYVLSYVHLALCSHGISETSGRLIHSSAPCSSAELPCAHVRSHDVIARDGHSHPNEDECKVLAFVKQGAVAPDVHAPCLEGHAFVAADVPQHPGRTLHTSGLFRLAPSRSPPFFG
jgi:hypothetical protein